MVTSERGPESNGSQRLEYNVYFIPSDVQIRDLTAVAYGDSLTTMATTGGNCGAAKVVETHERQEHDVGS